jgi:opacity protein-like surface antigen
MSINVGGGVLDYFDSETRGFTSVAGMWEARVAYGTRSRVGFEAAYVGFAQSVDALGLDTSALLVGSLVEGAARVNVPLSLRYFQPYVFGGVGYTRLDVVNDDFNTSSVDDAENAIHVPVGIGLGFRYAGLLFDVRGTVRGAINDTLLREDTTTDEAALHNWSAGGRVGWEF